MIVAVRLPDLPPSPRAQTEGRQQSIRPIVMFILTLSAALVFSRMILQVPFALLVGERFHASHTSIGGIYAVMALGFILGAPLCSRLARNWSPRALLRFNAGLALGCALTTGCAAVVTSLWGFGALYLIWGALLGGTTPLLLAVASSKSGDAVQGRLLGRANAMKTGASILAIALGAWVSRTFGFDPLFPLIAALYGAGAVGALVLSWHPDIQTVYSSAGRSTP